MAWIDQNLDEDSDFLVLTPPSNWAENPRAEWFPSLAQRSSVSTVQGSEWLPDRHFLDQIEIYEAYQACVFEDLACLDRVSQEYGIDYTHIYIADILSAYKGAYETSLPIGTALRNDPGYEPIYEKDDVLVFERVMKQK